MIHNTLKSTQLPERGPRSPQSAAQRRLWRYSRCRRSSQVESHRHSVCVLAADLNGGRGGGGGVTHTIHGLCHLCIGSRLPQVRFGCQSVMIAVSSRGVISLPVRPLMKH